MLVNIFFGGQGTGICIKIRTFTEAQQKHYYSYLIRLKFASLKVVGNEKGGGSGSWLLFEDAFGPWRSMSVYYLILLSSSPQRISVSCL
jgi:hypothetical protein